MTGGARQKTTFQADQPVPVAVGEQFRGLPIAVGDQARLGFDQEQRIQRVVENGGELGLVGEGHGQGVFLLGLEARFGEIRPQGGSEVLGQPFQA